jgi:hypothetical protein
VPAGTAIARATLSVSTGDETDVADPTVTQPGALLQPVTVQLELVDTVTVVGTGKPDTSTAALTAAAPIWGLAVVAPPEKVGPCCTASVNACVAVSVTPDGHAGLPRQLLASTVTE